MSKISIDQKDEEQAMSNITQVTFGLLLIIESVVLKRKSAHLFHLLSWESMPEVAL